MWLRAWRTGSGPFGWVAVLAFSLCLVAAAAAQPRLAARPPVALDLQQQPVGLGAAGDAWIDPDGEAIADNVANDDFLAWTPWTAGQVYRLGGSRVLWVRFTVPPSPDGERWYLEVPYPSVDKVTLYGADAIGQWSPMVAGDTVAVAQWPVPHRHPLMPLAVSLVEPRTYLLRVENGHSFSAPLQFVSEGWLLQSEQRTSLVLGMYFGLVVLAVVLATIGAVTLRDRAYALYALTVAFMGLTQAAMTGLAGLHLWPAWPWWNDRSSLALPVFSMAALLAFFGAVISLRRRARPAWLGLVLLGAAAVPVGIAILFVDPSLRFMLMVPYISTASTAGLLAVLWAWRRGDRFAPWLMLGSLPVAVGAAFPLARTAGLIPVSFLTMYGMQLGLAVELPVLLVMLMVRSQQRREHLRRMQGLDRIDPATGLLNEAVFHERLVRLIARSQRLKIRSAVLLVDIVNLEQIQHQFGVRAARELPLHVAGRLLGTARDIDSVARLGEQRFGLLLEGPLKADEVAEAAPRVVARCLMPFRGRPLEWVADVRVAQGLVPMDADDALDLMERLDALLAEVPPDSKRSVFLLQRPQAHAPRPAPTSAPMLTTLR